MQPETPLPSLHDLERRLDRLAAFGESRADEYGREREQLLRAREFLDLAPHAMDRLEELSTALFGKTLDEIEANLTHAIREILGQDRVVASRREVKNNRLQVHFEIHNQGDGEEVEDILMGQGGSVCNIFSVGLRLIALSQLSEDRHRPFLVLDEQDCWLRPTLIPRFMKLIREIARRLDLQVLVISHHPLDLFSCDTDRILALRPDREKGASIEIIKE
ncbi:ATP-binding protein [Salidesulfovibrio onnuriiensis]|uniref:ATP-binding protein n=1 Tax=Salidesulfovibrio onnuriiensis TaxID=2583823 RepID=UPI0011CBCB48|nr:ATP-binding protein [Salidesulfovibrio onnuriiensis]